MTSALLEVRGVHAGHGAAEVLFGIDLAVAPGEIVGVLGRNGMGKTTLLRTIMGLLQPRAGTITLAGRDITGWAPNRIARAGVGLVPEGRQLFANLSVDEHLDAFRRASPRGATHWTPARVFELFPALAARRSHGGSQLSGGEQQMLAIGRALVTNPVLLILDEAARFAVPSLPDYAATVPGRGISLWVAIQSLSQLDGVYGRAGALALREALESQVFYRPSDLATAQFLEERLGQVSAYAHSVSVGQDGGRSSEGRSERPVPLLVAQDVLQLPAEHVLVFHRDQPPARAQRADWRSVGGLRSRQGLPTPPVPSLPSAPGLPDVPGSGPDDGQLVLDVDDR